MRQWATKYSCWEIMSLVWTAYASLSAASHSSDPLVFSSNGPQAQKFVETTVTKIPIWLEVLTPVTMKMAVFWIVAPCRLVWVYQHSRGLYCLHHQGDDGSSTDLWNVGKLISFYMVQHPRRQPSSKIPINKCYYQP
jgi:hypothetical protein